MSLINLFNRVAESVHLVDYFQTQHRQSMLNADDMLATYERGHTFYVGLFIVVAGLLRIIYLGISREMASRTVTAEAKTK